MWGGSEDNISLAQIISHDIQSSEDGFGEVRSGYVEVLGPLLELVLVDDNYRICNVKDPDLDWHEAFQVVEKVKDSVDSQQLHFDTAEREGVTKLRCLGIVSRNGMVPQTEQAGEGVRARACGFVFTETGEKNTYLRVGVAYMDSSAFQGYGKTLVKIL